jgi:predicted kinase
MPKIILTIGASSSGKTYWAEDFVKNNSNWVNINRDEIRFILFTNGIRSWERYKFNKTNENRVTEVQEQLAYDAVITNDDVIISDTNLSEKVRQKWKDWAFAFGYEYEEKIFHESWETLVKRNAQREGGLSESLLWDQYLRFERQFGNILPYADEEGLRDTVIVDIDGTIASKGDRSPFDWVKVSEDSPRDVILAMVESLGKKYEHVTFLSGRDGICYQQTKDWIDFFLDDTYFEWDLYMRQVGDTRKDWVIKDELYETFVKGQYNVKAVFDDRLQMIRHWTVKNMPNIIQVGSYNEEF